MPRLKKGYRLALNRYDIAALRNADHVAFVRSDDGADSGIICYKHTVAGDYASEVVEYEIYVPSSVEFMGEQQGFKGNCYYSIGHCNMDFEFQTMCGALGVLDELELIWQPDMETVKEMIGTGLHADVLKMVVYRGDLRLHYRIGVTIAENEKRMIRGLSGEYPGIIAES